MFTSGCRYSLTTLLIWWSARLLCSKSVFLWRPGSRLQHGLQIMIQFEFINVDEKTFFWLGQVADSNTHTMTWGGERAEFFFVIPLCCVHRKWWKSALWRPQPLPCYTCMTSAIRATWSKGVDGIPVSSIDFMRGGEDAGAAWSWTWNRSFSRWPKWGGKKTAKMGYGLWLRRWRCEVTMPMSESKTCWWMMCGGFDLKHPSSLHTPRYSHLRSPSKCCWNVSPITTSTITRPASHDKKGLFVCVCVCIYISLGSSVCVLMLGSTLFCPPGKNIP